MDIHDLIPKPELENCKRLLCIQPHPDAGDWSVFDARNSIIKIIRTIKPDFVMTIDPWLAYEAHMDHTKCGQAASEAVLLHNYMFIKTDEQIDKEYEPYKIKGIAYTFTAKPNTIIDIDGYREKKFKAIAAHESQYPAQYPARKLNILKQYQDMRSQNLTKNETFRFGEGFKVLDPGFLLHIVPETINY